MYTKTPLVLSKAFSQTSGIEFFFLVCWNVLTRMRFLQERTSISSWTGRSLPIPSNIEALVCWVREKRSFFVLFLFFFAFGLISLLLVSEKVPRRGQRMDHLL
jgi:hypothetical protein